MFTVMGSEIKKRLLLSRRRTEIETLREKQHDHEEEIAGLEWQIEYLETALSDVRYWLHDWLLFHRPIFNPRTLLRKVEDALQ